MSENHYKKAKREYMAMTGLSLKARTDFLLGDRFDSTQHGEKSSQYTPFPFNPEKMIERLQDRRFVMAWWVFEWTYIEKNGAYQTQRWAVFEDLLKFAREQDVPWRIKRNRVVIAQTRDYIDEPTSQTP